MIDDLIHAEKILRALIDLDPAARTSGEFDELLVESLRLLSQYIDDSDDVMSDGE